MSHETSIEVAQTPLASWFAVAGRVQEVGAGQVIFEEGTPPTDVFFLSAGTVDLFVGPPSHRIFVRQTYTGTVLNVAAAFSGHTHSVTAITAEKVWLSVVPRATFLTWVNANPPGFTAALEQLSLAVSATDLARKDLGMPIKV